MCIASNDTQLYEPWYVSRHTIPPVSMKRPCCTYLCTLFFLPPHKSIADSCPPLSSQTPATFPATPHSEGGTGQCKDEVMPGMKKSDFPVETSLTQRGNLGLLWLLLFVCFVLQLVGCLLSMIAMQYFTGFKIQDFTKVTLKRPQCFPPIPSNLSLVVHCRLLCCACIVISLI